MVPAPELLEAAFAARLEAFALRYRARVRGDLAGSRRSNRRGAGLEFAEYRPFVLGDDVRRVDWTVYARLEQLVVRLSALEDDLSVHLLLDASASMGFGTPSKLHVAKRVLAALGFVALVGNERVSVVPFDARARAIVPIGRTRGRLLPMLRALEAVEADGSTSLERTVDTFLGRRSRPGLVVLASDLLDPSGFERPLRRLRSERHEVLLVHVLSADELRPPSRGDVAFVDSERGTRVELTIDDSALVAYRRRLDAFLASAREATRRLGHGYVRIDDADFEEPLLAALEAMR